MFLRLRNVPDLCANPHLRHVSFESHPQTLFTVNVTPMNPPLLPRLIGAATKISHKRRCNTRDAKLVPASIEQLEDRVLLTNAPTLEPIADVELLSGAPLHIPLDGFDLDQDDLTYTISTSNSLVTGKILQGNRSLRLNIQDGGEMVFELFEGRASRATDRIIELAETGFYDGTIFHRVIDQFVIQGGDPTGTGSGGSSLGFFDDQYDIDLQFTTNGLLAMAKSFDDTNDSQFFITEGAQRHLDFQHTIFGLLVEGESLREAISNVATDSSDRPVTDVVIQSADVFVDNENGVLMIEAPEGASGVTDITVTVTDSDGNSAQRTFRVTVAPDPVNTQPFLADIPVIQTAVDTTTTYQLRVIDAEGHTNGGTEVWFLDEEILDINQLPVPVRAPADLDYQVDFETGLLTITPTNGLTGTHFITVSAGVSADFIDYQIVQVNIAAMGVPVLGDPIQSTIDPTPTFRWSEVENAATYEIWVNDSTTGESGVIRVDGLTERRYTPTTPLPLGHSYVWTVRAIDSDGNVGPWAEHRSFTVTSADASAPPELVAMPNDEINANPTFAWSEISGADHYEIWVNDLTTGESGVIRVNDIAGTSFTPATPLKAGHRYVWTVRAFDHANNASPWATNNIFTVGAAANLLTPSSMTNDHTPKFEWSSVLGASGYEVDIIDLQSGAAVLPEPVAVSGTSWTPSEPLSGGGRYSWMVRAIDSQGHAGGWSDPQEFTTTATLIAPRFSTIDSTPTFKWSEIANVTHYELWVNNLTTGESAVIRERSLTENTFTPSSPLNVGDRYLWTVRGFHVDGSPTLWSSHQQFEVLAPTSAQPPALTLFDGPTLDTTPTLSWSPVSGASSYEIWVNNTTTGESGVIRTQGIEGESFTPIHPLPTGNDYIWTVRAYNEAGVAGKWAAHRRFSIAEPTAVAPPRLLAPAGGTIDPTPTLSWTPVLGAAQYDLWVNDLTTGESAVIRKTNISDPFFTAQTLVAGHRYVWTVRAINDAGQAGQWAANRTFEILAPQDAAPPTLSTPGATTIDSTPTFSWSEVPGAAQYDIWVNNLTTGENSVIRMSDLETNSYTLSEALAVGDRYLWTVRAIAENGTVGKWASHATFDIVDSQAPELIAPLDPTLDTTPTFEWSAVSGAATYEIWVNDLTSGEEGVIREKGISGTQFTPSTPLAADHEYVWTVRAVTDNGATGPWQDHGTFSIVSLSRPTAVAPIGASNSAAPTFEWTEVPGAAAYDLWVNNLTTGESQVIREKQLPGNRFTNPQALPSGNYVWTVRAIGADGEVGPWSTHRQFSIANANDTPQPIALNEIERGDEQSVPNRHESSSDWLLASVEKANFNAEILTIENQLDVELQSDGPGSTQGDSIDLVMENWSAMEWWTSQSRAPQASIESSATDMEPESDDSRAPIEALFALALPPALPKFLRRRGRKDKDRRSVR